MAYILIRVGLTVQEGLGTSFNPNPQKNSGSVAVQDKKYYELKVPYTKAIVPNPKGDGFVEVDIVQWDFNPEYKFTVVKTVDGTVYAGQDIVLVGK